MSDFIEHYLVEKACTLEDFCSIDLGWSRSFYEEIIQLGAIYVNTSRSMQNTNLTAGDYLRLHIQPKRYPLIKNISEHIVHSTDDFYLINKPTGLPCHPTLDNYKENLIYQLHLAGYDDALLTHRLDVATSGLILFARNKDFQTKFNAMLACHKVKKIYHAKSEKTLARGTYLHYMIRSKTAPKILRAQKGENDLECVLKILSSEKGQHTIELISGRSHQIRAQMAFLGAPILGDTLYGAKASQRLELYAKKISFMYQENLFSFALS